MAERAIRRDVEPILTVPAARPVADWRRLGAGWIVLPAGALPGLPGSAMPEDRRFVLLHPARGVTVLDLFPAAASRPRPGWLEAELLLAGFLRRFDPRLPVHRIHLAEPELPQLHGVLARAFARSEPLDLPGGDAWMGAVQATLAASPLQAGAARRRPAGRRGRRYRRAAAALFLAGAAAALPGDAARLTAPEPGPAAISAPPLPQVARVDPPPLPAPPPLPSGGRLARLQPPPEPEEALPLPPIPPPATTAGLDPLPLPTAPRLPSFATLAALPAPMPVPAPAPASVPEASRPAERSEERRPAPRPGARVATPRRVPGSSSDTDTIGNATPRCRDIVLRVQLGEELSNADRGYLRSGCGQRP
jgi:hypothetical protein